MMWIIISMMEKKNGMDINTINFVRSSGPIKFLNGFTIFFRMKERGLIEEVSQMLKL